MNCNQRREQEKRGVAPTPPGASASVQNMLADALQHHQAGRLGDAERLYRQILGIDPHHADSLHLLGMVAYSIGRHEVAVDLIGQAIAVNANVAMYHSNFGNVLKEQGRMDAAVACWRRALALDPDYADAHLNLGAALREQGRLDEAVQSCRKTIALKPDCAGAHFNLGAVLKDLARLDEAVQSFRMAIALRPDYFEAHCNLGAALREQGQLDEAAQSFGQAIALRPDYADAYSNLGAILKELGRLDEAVRSYREAIALRPDYAEAHSNLGAALREQGRLDEAVATYGQAIALKPDHAEAHSNLGNALQELGRLDEAVAAYGQAIALKPDYAEAHSNLGNALQELGRLDEAGASHLRALEIRPDSLQFAINARLLLPIIPESRDAIAFWRERYQAGIVSMTDSPAFPEDSVGNVNTRSFYLAYHNADNRPMMEALHRLFRTKVDGLTFTAPHVADWQSPAARCRRIRVGFLSEFLVAHTIGNLNRGFIQHLDRDRFDVVLIHTPKAKRDAFRNNLDVLADKTITLPPGLEAQQRAVAAEELDVLLYPDIGMAPSSYFLAYARLAPVQAVTWGHPDTTGIDTIDYFLSSEPTEPECADDHYTEILVRLDRLNCYYNPPRALADIQTRADLGLPETGNLYGCPQSLFKFHPDFDAVLAAIANGDPAGHIVLAAGRHRNWADRLRARWAKNFPVLLERTLFLPHMPRDRFIALLARLDVLLDPIHFGSGNTIYEAMVGGTPAVTWPGRFMRGRIVAGAYRQMGIADAPVAPRIEDYAPLALALGRDPDRREALRQSLRAAAGRELFTDTLALRGLEAFLEAAVVAAGRGEKLPTGWRPATFTTGMPSTSATLLNSGG